MVVGSGSPVCVCVCTSLVCIPNQRSNYNPVKDSSDSACFINPSLSIIEEIAKKYPRMEFAQGHGRRVCRGDVRACVNIPAEMEGRERGLLPRVCFVKVLSTHPLCQNRGALPLTLSSPVSSSAAKKRAISRVRFRNRGLLPEKGRDTRRRRRRRANRYTCFVQLERPTLLSTSNRPAES